MTVLIPPYDNPSEGGRTFAAGGVRIDSLAVNKEVPEESWRQAIEQPRLAWRAVERALELQPDVVHVFKPKAVSGLAQAIAWYRRRVAGGPALVLDTDDWEGNGGWNDYERYPWWQKLACDWQEQWGLTHADAITAASRTLQAQAWSRRVLPVRVRYLPNGLDPADYPGWQDADPTEARAMLGLGSRPVVLLYTRFFEFEPRRVLDVLRAARRGVPDMVLLVVGAGKFGQERQLAEMAQADGQEEAVRLAGWQEPARLPGLLKAADVALFPADDNLANRAKCSVKVLEMMWLGVPVVADRVGQYAEYVQDGVSGMLTEPGDPGTMAEAVGRVLEDRGLRARLVEAGRRRVVDDFDWTRLAVEAERAYEVALRGRGRWS